MNNKYIPISFLSTTPLARLPKNQFQSCFIQSIMAARVGNPGSQRPGQAHTIHRQLPFLKRLHTAMLKHPVMAP